MQLKGRPDPAEEDVQLALCEYVRKKYPQVWYRSDLGGVWLPFKLAKINKRLQRGRGFPDFSLPLRTVLYAGLYIEIKKSRDELFKKDGSMRGSKHIAEQRECLRWLRSQGFFAVFGAGLDNCMDVVDFYMRLARRA